MGDERDRGRSGDYRGARIGAATAFVAAIVFLLVWDAVSADHYDVSPIVLTILVAAVLTLLGLEALDFLRR